MSTYRHPVILAATVLLLAVGLPLVPAAASEQASGAAVPTRKLTTSQLAARILTADEVRAATGITVLNSFSTPSCDELSVLGVPVTHCNSYSIYDLRNGEIPDTVTQTGGSSVTSYATSKEVASRFAFEGKSVKKAVKAGKATLLVSKPDLLIWAGALPDGGSRTYVVSVKGSNLVDTSCSQGTDASRRSCAMKLNQAQAAKLSAGSLSTSAAPPTPTPAGDSDPSQSPDSGGTTVVTDGEFSPGGA